MHEIDWLETKNTDEIYEGDEYSREFLTKCEHCGYEFYFWDVFKFSHYEVEESGEVFSASVKKQDTGRTFHRGLSRKIGSILLPNSGQGKKPAKKKGAKR